MESNQELEGLLKRAASETNPNTLTEITTRIFEISHERDKARQNKLRLDQFRVRQGSVRSIFLSSGRTNTIDHIEEIPGVGLRAIPRPFCLEWASANGLACPKASGVWRQWGKWGKAPLMKFR